jgi:hypothetical protein
MEKHYTYKTFTCLTEMCQFLNEKGLELSEIKIIRNYPTQHLITIVYNDAKTEMIVG